MNLEAPDKQPQTGSTRLVVNFFGGGPRSKVEMAIGGAGFAPLTRAQRKDPFVEEVYARNSDTKKPWVLAGLSSQIWQATLPADLPIGTHAVRGRAHDEFGRPHHASMLLEVTT